MNDDALTMLHHARQALAVMTEERDALRETRQKGCDCTDDEACRFARERDEARAQAAKLEAVLVSRHGGEPVALLAELDEARAEVERLKVGAVRAVKEVREALLENLRDTERERDTLRAEVDRLRAIIVACAEATGTAHIEPTASLDFMRYIPKEIGAALKSVAERQRAADCDRVRNPQGPEGEDGYSLESIAMRIESEPLVTEGE